MAKNVEIKARASDFDRQRELAAALSDGPVEVLRQRDTFFHVARGRLKLREIEGRQAHLIHYHRSDRKGPKTSRYTILAVADAAPLNAMLAEALGIRGIVAKKRLLYRAGQTRIHLDEVTGLGRFIELEVVLYPGQTSGSGAEIAQDMMARLQIQERDLVTGAYLDLLTDETPLP